MPDRSGNFCVAAAVSSMLMLAAGAAWPQAASPPSSPGTQAPVQQAAPDHPAPQQAEPASSTAPPRQENPGLFNEMGKLFENSLSVLPTLKSPADTLGDWNARAKDAARDASDSLSRLAKPFTMVTGRSACLVAVNGAPDCKAGADRLCQSKGYKEGKSLNTDSAQTCSAKVLIPGRPRKPDDCRTDNYVTSALCQ
jgi:hypothetical protein